MLRKMMIALFASASVAMLAPDAASARGGFGGGGGGFHGGGGGGFHGGGMGMGGGGFRGGGMGYGRRRLPGRRDRRRRFPCGRDRRRWFPCGRFAGCRISRRHALPSTVSTVASTTVSGIGDFRLLWRQSD